MAFLDIAICFLEKVENNRGKYVIVVEILKNIL